MGAPDGGSYSLGRAGWVVLDMGDTITDTVGDELRVIKDDDSPEGYNVQVAPDPLGPRTPIGSGVGSASFDVTPAGVAEFRYVRIEDDGVGAGDVLGAGFDLDAVRASD